MAGVVTFTSGIVTLLMRLNVSGRDRSFAKSMYLDVKIDGTDTKRLVSKGSENKPIRRDGSPRNELWVGSNPPRNQDAIVTPQDLLHFLMARESRTKPSWLPLEYWARGVDPNDRQSIEEKTFG